MLSWYETRSECNLQHNDQVIPSSKKILLTEEQAKVHNTYQEQVFKCDEPSDFEEAGVGAEYQEWKSQRSDVKGQKSRVAKSKS